MKKFFTFCAAMLVALAANADPVVLPAVLDTSNVSFRSDNLPNFVLASGDYAGTYFDMGAHDTPTDTLLYAQWDVTIQPITYNVAVVVYNTNSWRVQLDILNQSDEVVKAIRYKGSSGQKGQYGIGSLDLSDLAAGNYKVRVHAATAYSAMKLRDVIFEADYSGATVNLPGTLLPPYAELSAGASVVNNAIAFAPSTANQEYATWNVSVAEAGDYHVTIDITGTNCHDYSVALLSSDGQTQIGAVAEGSCHEDSGVKELGIIAVPAAGDYIVKLTNATQWSNAVLSSITLTPLYTVAGVAALCGVEWANNAAQNDMTYSEGAFRWTSGPVYYDGTSTWGFKVCKDHTWTAFPNDNYELKPDWKLTSGAGYYNVEIAYTTAPQAIEVTATYLYPKVEVAGDFNEWAHEKLTYNPSGYFYKNIPLTAGNREFKVIINDVWYGKNGTMTRVDCENKTFESEASNCPLLADVDGYYTFYYQNDLVSVSYPTSFTRTVDAEGADKYQTLCVPFDASVSGATVYAFGTDTESGVTINSIAADALEAGKSYLIMPEGAGDIVISAIADGDTVIVPEDLHGLSGFYGILGADYEYVYADNNFATYVLQDDNKFHKVIGTASATITSTHAYLHVASGITAPALRIIMDATNIENLEAVDEAVKFVKNGQLFIKKNGVVYNAVGAVVK